MHAGISPDMLILICTLVDFISIDEFLLLISESYSLAKHIFCTGFIIRLGLRLTPAGITASILLISQLFVPVVTFWPFHYMRPHIGPIASFMISREISISFQGRFSFITPRDAGVITFRHSKYSLVAANAVLSRAYIRCFMPRLMYTEEPDYCQSFYDARVIKEKRNWRLRLQPASCYSQLHTRRPRSHQH